MLKEVIQKDFQLGMLDLSQNDIGVKGMEVLGSALAVGGNTSLRCLKIDFNPDNDKNDGVGKLCEGLRTNTTLKVYICRNQNIARSLIYCFLFFPFLRGRVQCCFSFFQSMVTPSTCRN